MGGHNGSVLKRANGSQMSLTVKELKGRLPCLWKPGGPLCPAGSCHQGPDEHPREVGCQSPRPQSEGRKKLMDPQLRNALGTELSVGPAQNGAVC